MEDHHLGIFHRDGGGGARLVVEQAHLSKEIILSQNRQNDLASIVGKNRHFDPPAHDHEQRVTGIALEKYDRVLGKLAAGRDGKEAIEVRFPQIREERDFPEEIGTEAQGMTLLTRESTAATPSAPATNG